jgi:hypothetical protein
LNKGITSVVIWSRGSARVERERGFF